MIVDSEAILNSPVKVIHHQAGRIELRFSVFDM